jgi:hypothetical protein
VYPLVTAAWSDNLEACKALLENGANPNKHNSADDGDSALVAAVNHGKNGYGGRRVTDRPNPSLNVPEDILPCLKVMIAAFTS